MAEWTATAHTKKTFTSADGAVTEVGATSKKGSVREMENPGPLHVNITEMVLKIYIYIYCQGRVEEYLYVCDRDKNQAMIRLYLLVGS